MLSLLLAAALAAPLRAGDDAALILFKGGPAAASVPPGAGPGQAFWDSGPSEPAGAPFESVLFQGTLTDPGIAFEACVQAGSGCGPWVKAEVDREPNGRFWGRFFLRGAAGARLLARAVLRGGAPGGSFEIFRFEGGAVVPEETPAPRSPPPGALSSGPRPEVVERAGWRAAPATEAYIPMLPERVSVHHTAAAQPLTLEDAIQEMRVIQRFHQKGRGWIDIGYHFLIDGSGRVFAGRPEAVVGAHVRDRNTGNVGISLMGNFHPPATGRPTQEQISSLLGLLKWLLPAYDISPAELRGHRDQGSTDCPGDNLYSRLEDIRREAGAARPQPPPATALRSISAPPLFRILESSIRARAPRAPFE